MSCHFTDIPDFPVLALAATARDMPENYCRAIANSFAMEYTPDPERFVIRQRHLKPALNAGVRVRFHGRYFGQEIGPRIPASPIPPCGFMSQRLKPCT